MMDQHRSTPPHVFYDDVYATDNYFHHTERLYRPYIRSLIAHVGLKRGSRVLDAGCGQGFFSNLFASEGMVVYATDMSIVGLKMARKHYGNAITGLFVSDLHRVPTNQTFDCVFIRSCSLYNTERLDQCGAVTVHLLSLVKPDGLLILAYNSNLSGQSGGWKHHRLEEMGRVLALSFPAVDLYFINRLDALLLGRFAFNRLVTRINKVISERTKLGGEIVAVFRKNEHAAGVPRARVVASDRR